MARPAKGPGILRAVSGLLVLAVAAFGSGALAGLLWKEPGLLMAYLRGETTEVAWSTVSEEPALPVAELPDPPPIDPPQVAAAPTPARPKVAAPPPPEPEPVLVDAPPAPAPEPEPAKPAPAPEPEPVKPAPAAKTQVAVAAAPPSSRIAVQVGAFADREAADRLRERLEKAGFPSYLVGGTPGYPWRVRVGPYASRDEAGLTALRLERGEKLPTWVLDEGAE